MKIGFTEFLLIFLIVLVVLGPTVIPRLRRWYRRAGAAETRAEHRRARAKAAAVRWRDEVFARARFAAGLVFGGALLAYILYLFIGPLAYVPQKHPAAAWQDAALTVSADAATAAQGLDISPYRDPVAVVEQDGWLYAAVDGGTVIRIRPDGTGLTEVLTTGGDITGLCFGADGALYLADARLTGTLAGGGGILRATFDGWAVSVEPLVTAADGLRLTCPAAVAAAADGTVYFTDFSSVSASGEKSAKNAFYTELAARTGTGRVYAYSPASGRTVCLAENLQGAGGLALDEAGGTLYVSESNAGRVWALSLKSTVNKPADIAALAAGTGSDGSAALLAQGLAGYPAGLALGEDGTVYIAQCGTRSRWLEGAPTLLRRVILHLPRLTRAWLLAPKADYAAALLFAPTGNQRGAVLSATGQGGRATGVCFTSEGCWLANADGSTIYRAAAQGASA